MSAEELKGFESELTEHAVEVKRFYLQQKQMQDMMAQQ